MGICDSQDLCEILSITVQRLFRLVRHHCHGTHSKSEGLIRDNDIVWIVSRLNDQIILSWNPSLGADVFSGVMKTKDNCKCTMRERLLLTLIVFG